MFPSLSLSFPFLVCFFFVLRSPHTPRCMSATSRVQQNAACSPRVVDRCSKSSVSTSYCIWTPYTSQGTPVAVFVSTGCDQKKVPG
ncbi:hypothetical protein HDV63DRAFT_361148 [Trichoderma sp. SZMC 28014]